MIINLKLTKLKLTALANFGKLITARALEIRRSKKQKGKNFEFCLQRVKACFHFIRETGKRAACACRGGLGCHVEIITVQNIAKD